MSTLISPTRSSYEISFPVTYQAVENESLSKLTVVTKEETVTYQITKKVGNISYSLQDLILFEGNSLDIIKRISSNTKFNDNLFFKMLGQGEIRKFETILSDVCLIDKGHFITQIFTVVNVPPLAKLIYEYGSFFLTKGVQDIVTVTVKQPRLCLQGIRAAAITLTTPFQETLVGLKNLKKKVVYYSLKSMETISKESFKPYIELLKLLLDCGETLKRCPAEYNKSAKSTISIVQKYEEDFPPNFFSSLTSEDFNIDRLTDEVFEFFTKKAGSLTRNVIPSKDHASVL